MRGQCTICAETFEDETQDQDIAALPCGHTFHYVCVSKWLENSSTCPHCRQRVNRRNVISKLFFESSENSQLGGDTGALSNHLNEISLQLKQRDKDLNNLQQDLKNTQKMLKEVEKNKKEAERQFREEKQESSELRKQLKYHRKQQKEADLAKEECFQVKKKLEGLKAVENLVKGSADDIDELMNSQGSGEHAVKQLATFNVILKQELDRVKLDKKKLNHDMDKMKQGYIEKNKLLKERTAEVSALREHLSTADDDVKHAERERDSLMKKLNKLQAAVDSPSSTSSSLVHRLMHESPAPFVNPKTTSQGNNRRIEIVDFNETVAEVHPLNETAPDLFADSPPTSPNTLVRQACKENNFQYVKIKSSASLPPPKRQKRESDDIDSTNLLTFNIMKGKAKSNALGTTASGSLYRTGYNGMGGHEKCKRPADKAPPKFTLLAKKNVSKPGSKGLGIKSTAPRIKPPAFPSMDNYINLD